MTGLILYFSGTGNTKAVAEGFQKSLQKRGHAAVLHSLEENADLSEISYDFLILGFPKYYEYPVLLVQKNLKQALPKREKQIPALAFCTQAGPLNTDFTKIEKMLKRKNHLLTVSVSFSYANNMFIFPVFQPTEDTKVQKNRDKIQEQIEPLLNDFFSNQIRKERVKAWQKPVFHFVAAACTKLMPVFAMRFSADESCIRCGLCAKRCPVHNIEIKEGRPRFHRNCLFCMRCINSCPTNSIRYHGRKCPQYKSGGLGNARESATVERIVNR